MKILLLGLVFFYTSPLYVMNENDSTNSTRKKMRSAYKIELKHRKKELRSSLLNNDIDTFKKNHGNINLNSLVISTKDGKQPFLHQAVRGNSMFFVKHFIKRCRITINQENSQGQTPLFYATYPKILILLSSHGANPNHKDRLGNSPAHNFVLSQDYSSLKNLLDHYKSTINLMQRNKAGLTPLALAYKLESEKCVKALKSLTTKQIKRDEPCIICHKQARKFSAINRHLTPCCTRFLCTECMLIYNQFEACQCGRKYFKDIPLVQELSNRE